MDFKEIKDLSFLVNDSLRDRVRRSQVPFSREFVFYLDKKEAGVLCYERWPSNAFIYEIFVLSEFRNCGVGSFALSLAEKMALEDGLPFVRLEPSAALGSDLDRLVYWYKSKGYKDEEFSDSDRKFLRKDLNLTNSK